MPFRTSRSAPCGPVRSRRSDALQAPSWPALNCGSELELRRSRRCLGAEEERPHPVWRADRSTTPRPKSASVRSARPSVRPICASRSSVPSVRPSRPSVVWFARPFARPSSLSGRVGWRRPHHATPHRNGERARGRTGRVQCPPTGSR